VGTNLKVPLFLSQAAAPYLRAQSGCIVNIVDIHADRPLKGYPVYCLAKAGLAMLTKSMARELAPEVRVNGIAPGAILWPEIEAYEPHHQEIIEKTALKRQGHPEDIARTALFLVRDAQYITGQIIAVEGGRILSN
jgi:pteridine reductase